MSRKLVLIWWFSLALLAAGLLPAACQGPPDYDEARRALVARQLLARGITDPRVLAAMGKVPRHLFVAPALASQAYGTTPSPSARTRPSPSLTSSP